MLVDHELKVTLSWIIVYLLNQCRVSLDDFSYIKYGQTVRKQRRRIERHKNNQSKRDKKQKQQRNGEC